MPSEEPDEIEIRTISADDKLTGMSLGLEYNALKIFLTKHAKNFHDSNLARTYAAFRGTKVIGYITLVCGEVVLDEGDDLDLLNDETISYKYKQYPAVKIARLAVDKSLRDQGLGTQLIDLAIGISTEIICPAVGCRFVVVDAKQSAIAFYDKRGFTLLNTSTNKARSAPVMFLDLFKSKVDPSA